MYNAHVDLSFRVDEPEWLDSRPLSGKELERALRFLSASNRLLGGHSCVLRRLDGWSKRWRPGEIVRILDVGVGGGDLLLAVRRWAERRGVRVALTGIDSSPAVLHKARKLLRGKDVELREADLFAFAEAGRKFDYVTASLLLHHFPITRQVEALKALDRLSSRGVVVSDLRRTRPAYWGVTAVTKVFGDPISAHDGPVSVRRAFTLPELTAMALSAGLPYLKAEREPFFRATLAGDKL